MISTTCSPSSWGRWRRSRNRRAGSGRWPSRTSSTSAPRPTVPQRSPSGCSPSPPPPPSPRAPPALTKRLLAFSRRQSLAPRPFDLNALVRSTNELLPRLLGETITVRLALAEEGCLAMADPVQVETALMNLCLNARDAMPEGGLLVIETATTALDEKYARLNADAAPGTYAVLSVGDTGCGIPPEQMAMVFEPFFTTKGVGKGTGLGLSMVDGFVRQSGGHVKLYSERGVGTTVRLYFPAA